MNFLKSKKIIFGGLLGTIITFTFVSLSLAACPASSSGSGEICFEDPLEYKTVDEVLASVLNRLQGVIVVIAIIFIVIGALLYMTSAGNESRMTMAKGAIVASVIGLAIGIAAPSFIKEIYIALGNEDALSGSTLVTKSTISIVGIALNVLNFLLGIVGVVAIIMLVAAGMMYLTSAGNDTRIETAKNMTKWSIIGITIALAALIIVKQVARFFAAAT